MPTPIPTKEAVDEALKYVALGSVKNRQWFEGAIAFSKHCESDSENVDQAAMRILAAEVRRLQETVYSIRNRASLEWDWKTADGPKLEEVQKAMDDIFQLSNGAVYRSEGQG